MKNVEDGVKIMNSKARKICLLVVMLVILASILTACQLNDTLEDKLDKYDLKAKITYHANGGNVNDTIGLSSAAVYYKEGDKVYNMMVDKKKDGTLSVSRDNYTFVGWFYPEKNEDGSLKYNDDDLVELGDAFDFSSYVAKDGDSIDLYAKWVKNQSVQYLLATEDMINNQLVYTDNNQTITVNAGECVSVEPFEKSYIEEKTMDPLMNKASDYSFVGYYYDAECKNPVKWPIESTNEDKDITIYVKYVPSEWTIIKTAAEFASIFGEQVDEDGKEFYAYDPSNKEKYYESITGKYYIKNDIDGTITGTDGAEDTCITIHVATDITFSGVIMGNGFTVSNFSFQNDSVASYSSASIFGDIESGAVIENITFKDINVSYKANSKAKILAYFFAGDIKDDATISNVEIDGGTMTVNLTQDKSAWLNETEMCPIYSGNDKITITTAPTLEVKR